MKSNLSKLILIVFVMGLLLLVIPVVSSCEVTSKFTESSGCSHEGLKLLAYTEDKVVSDTRFQEGATWWRPETSPAPTSTLTDPETDITVFFYGTPAGGSPEITIKKGNPFEDLRSQLTSVYITQKPNTGSFDHAVISFPLSTFPSFQEGQKFVRIEENGEFSRLPTFYERESGRIFVATSHFSLFLPVCLITASLPLAFARHKETTEQEDCKECDHLALLKWILGTDLCAGCALSIILVEEFPGGHIIVEWFCDGCVHALVHFPCPCFRCLCKRDDNQIACFMMKTYCDFFGA